LSPKSLFLAKVFVNIPVCPRCQKPLLPPAMPCRSVNHYLSGFATLHVNSGELHAAHRSCRRAYMQDSACGGKNISVDCADRLRPSSITVAYEDEAAQLDHSNPRSAPNSITFYLRRSYRSRRSPSWKPISFSFCPPCLNHLRSTDLTTIQHIKTSLSIQARTLAGKRRRNSS
jgi:hypothetical protein